MIRSFHTLPICFCILLCLNYLLYCVCIETLTSLHCKLKLQKVELFIDIVGQIHNIIAISTTKMIL